MLKRQHRFGLAFAFLCVTAPMQLSARPGNTVIEKEFFLVECHTEIRRDEAIESAQSFTIEVDIEKHTVQPETNGPEPSTTIDALHGALAVEARIRSLPKNPPNWPEEWGAWKVRNFGGNDARSFGAVATTKCKESCALHQTLSLDMGGSYFILSQSSGNPFLVTWDTKREFTKLYPGSAYANWNWTANNGGGEQFQFEIGADKKIKEVGTCKWSKRRV